MLRAKLGLTAATAEGERATEQNAAFFDLKTCRAQSLQGAAAEGLQGLKHSSATALADPSLCLAEHDPEPAAEGPFTGSFLS